MKRRLLNFLTILSLLLCVAVVALWVRSYFARDVLRYRPTKSLLVVQSAIDTGGLCFSLTWHDDFGLPPGGIGFTSDHEPLNVYSLLVHPKTSNRLLFRAFGFAAYVPGHFRGSGGVLIPFWSVFLLLASGPTFLFWRRVRSRHRARRGLCPRCGYDLRATPGRCPECGNVAPVAS